MLVISGIFVFCTGLLLGRFIEHRHFQHQHGFELMLAQAILSGGKSISEESHKKCGLSSRISQPDE